MFKSASVCEATEGGTFRSEMKIYNDEEESKSLEKETTRVATNEEYTTSPGLPG